MNVSIETQQRKAFKTDSSQESATPYPTSGASDLGKCDRLYSIHQHDGLSAQDGSALAPKTTAYVSNTRIFSPRYFLRTFSPARQYSYPWEPYRSPAAHLHPAFPHFTSWSRKTDLPRRCCLTADPAAGGLQFSSIAASAASTSARSHAGKRRCCGSASDQSAVLLAGVLTQSLPNCSVNLRPISFSAYHQAPLNKKICGFGD